MEQVWSAHGCPQCGTAPTLIQKLGNKVVDLCSSERCAWVFIVVNYQPSLLHYAETMNR